LLNYCETHVSKTKCVEICKSNNPAISGGYDTPPVGAELGSGACPGVHTRGFWKKFSCITGLFLVIFLTLSITAQAVEKNSAGVKSTMRVAVISFQPIMSTKGQGNTVICPLCGTVYSSGTIIAGSEKIVEEVFVDKLHELKEIELIPSDKVQGVYKRIASESPKDPLLNILKKVGSELGADVLAVGYVYRYTEREGYSYSAKHPASVFFEIHLIKAIDGSIIWRGSFDKTQKSLLEDVFQISSFFKSGGKWMTARQLTEQGMNKIFETFPSLKH
jgi:hypothetical protein